MNDSYKRNFLALLHGAAKNYRTADRIKIKQDIIKLIEEY